MIHKPWIVSNQLLQAIELKQCAVAEGILNNDFDVDSILIDGKSAISVCVERGSVEIAQMLIKRGCSLSLKSQKGETPLHLAVLKSNYACVRMLVDNRADVTSVDILGRTALHLACKINSLDIVKLLIENSRAEIINFIDRGGTTPLLTACRYGDIRLIGYLLSKGGKVNITDVHGESPLLGVIQNNFCSSRMLKILLDANADVNQKNNACETALLKAFHHSWNFKGRTLEDVCSLLIDYKSDINVKNILGQTPLHLAVSSDCEVLVRKLLNAGSDIEAVDNMGFSPLFYAYRKKERNIMELLMEAGANFHNANWPVLGYYSLFDFIQEKSKCRSLSNLCRIVIRKHLHKQMDRTAPYLPLPSRLIRYILLEDGVKCYRRT